MRTGTHEPSGSNMGNNKETSAAAPYIVESSLCEKTDLLVLSVERDNLKNVRTFTQAWAVGKKGRQTIYHCHLCQRQTFNRHKAVNHALDELNQLCQQEKDERIKQRSSAIRSLTRQLMNWHLPPLELAGLLSMAPSKNE